MSEVCEVNFDSEVIEDFTFKVFDKYKDNLNLNLDVFLKGLDKFQAEIVNLDNHGVLRVIANAGSGKSHSLIVRTLKLILKDKINPSQIVLITFTNKSAKDVRVRYGNFITDSVPTEDAYKVSYPTISTVHSFGYKILQNFGIRKSIMSEYKSLKLIKQILYEVLRDSVSNDLAKRVQMSMNAMLANNELHLEFIPLISPQGEFQSLLYAKDMYKEENEKYLNLFAYMSEFSLTGICKTLSNTPPDPSKTNTAFNFYVENSNLSESDFKLFLKLYFKAKYTTGCLDFHDMMFYPILLLTQNKKALEYVQKKYSHVMVDEAQDLDISQALLSLLVSGFSGIPATDENKNKDRTLTLVGDVKQTLYGWRTANPDLLENLDRLNTEKDKTKSLSLTMNYRSPEELVKLSNIFSDNFKGMKIHHSIPVAASDKKCIKVLRFPTQAAEINYISYVINEQIQNEGMDYKDFAILCRSNKNLVDFEAGLIAKRIPYSLRHDSRSITKNSVYRFIFSMYSILLNLSDINSLTEILSNVYGMGNQFTKNIYAAFMRAKGMDKNFNILKISMETIPGNTKNHKNLYHIIQYFIIPIREFFLKDKTSLVDLNSFLEPFFKRKFAFEGDAYHEGGSLKIKFEFKSVQKVLTTFNNIYYSLMEFPEFTSKVEGARFLEVYQLIQLSQDPSMEGTKPENNKVILSTIHSFKGKEAKVVYHSLLRRSFPLKESEYFDNMCMMYVAVTRATKALVLTYSDTILDYRGLPIKSCDNQMLDLYVDSIQKLKDSDIK